MITCPHCKKCNWDHVHRSPINPAEDTFKCRNCGATFTRYPPATKQTPLEWSALWSAMRTEYDKAAADNRHPELIETTEDLFFNMLGAVPPMIHKRGAFLAGEANHHNDNNEAVYAGFIEIEGRFFARYATVKEFQHFTR